ncbi:hypothetical protein LSAT2_003276 [Lamellibrachia satsuma]|nr:hypothetical protein LSAT2_003276 [Lamellibrachia satsuma]
MPEGNQRARGHTRLSSGLSRAERCRRYEWWSGDVEDDSFIRLTWKLEKGQECPQKTQACHQKLTQRWQAVQGSHQRSALVSGSQG